MKAESFSDKAREIHPGQYSPWKAGIDRKLHAVFLPGSVDG